MSGLIVDIQNKRYGRGAPVLADLQFAAAPGEFVAIIGPSGAGKSTLLGILAGLIADFAGAVHRPDAARLSVVFQEPRLMPWLTVAQNLQLVATALSADQLEVLLQKVGLEDCAHRFPGQLSGGMQRRVALLRAFVVAPGLLLLDEPFQSLDAPTAQQLRDVLLDLWRQTLPTVIFVTHSLSEALSLADRVIFLSSSPATVLLDFKVPTPRAGDLNSPAVMAMQQVLMESYPDLLKGALTPAA